jgi:hypothetical protein
VSRLYMVMLRDYADPPEEERGPPMNNDGTPRLGYQQIALPQSEFHWSHRACFRGGAFGWGGCRCFPLETWRPFESRNGISVYLAPESAERMAKMHNKRLRRETRVVYFDDDKLPTWTSDADIAAKEQEDAMLRAADELKAAESGVAPRPMPVAKPKKRRERQVSP